MRKPKTRRRLLGDIVAALRGEPALMRERAQESFSLKEFYASREPPARELPFIVVREGLPAVTTTAVGLSAPPEGHDDGDLA